MHKVLVNRLGGLSLPRKIVVGLTDRPDMALGVCRGRKTTKQQQQQQKQLFGEDVVAEEVYVCGVVERGWGYIRKFCTV